MRRWRRLSLALLALLGLLAWWLLRGDDEATGGVGVLTAHAPAEELPSELPAPAGSETTAPQALATAGAAPGSGASDPAAALPDGLSRLVVRVTWERDGTPAEGIGLRVLPWDQPHPHQNVREGLTDAQGTWTLAPAPLGHVTAYSDRGSADSADIVPGQTSEVALSIPPGTLVRGLVLDPDARPVPGADIWLSTYGNRTDGTIVARSDTDGRFVLRDVGAWRSLNARAAGYAPSPLVQLGEELPEELDVELRLGGPGATLRGLVLDAGGQPVADAYVLAGPEHGFPGPDPRIAGGGPPPLERHTGPDGRFEVRDLPPGHVPVGVVARGHSPWQGGVELAAGETHELRVELLPGALVSGTVRDGTGRVLGGARVMAGPRYAGIGWVETESDASGRYELRDLPLGSQQVRASLKGAGKDQRGLAIEPGQSYAWDPMLSLGLQVRGRVVDASGEPVQGLNVQLDRLPGGDGWRATAKVAVDGSFVLDNCSDVDHELAVFLPTWEFPPLARVTGVRPGPDELLIEIPADARQLAVVSGRVADARGVVPAGLSVGLHATGSTSGQGGQVDAATGAFEIAKVRAGSYQLWVSVEGGVPTIVPVTDVRGGERRDLGLVVLPDPGTVVARLRLAPPLAPRDVSASIQSPDGLWHYGALAAPTDGGDTWRSGPLPPGDFVLRVRGRLVVEAPRPVRVEAGRETQVELDVARGVAQSLSFVLPAAEKRHLRVRLRDAAGQLVLDEPLEITPLPEAGESRALVSPVVVPGRFVLQASLDGQDVLTADIDVPAGADVAPLREFRLE